jgi:hypothetical protein
VASKYLKNKISSESIAPDNCDGANRRRRSPRGCLELFLASVAIFRRRSKGFLVAPPCTLKELRNDSMKQTNNPELSENKGKLLGCESIPAKLIQSGNCVYGF